METKSHRNINIFSSNQKTTKQSIDWIDHVTKSHKIHRGWSLVNGMADESASYGDVRRKFKKIERLDELTTTMNARFQLLMMKIASKSHVPIESA